jgi:hypothetical protein
MTAGNVVTATFKVVGLKQAAENLLNLASGELRTKIARDASRAAAWVVGDAVKDATYTKFERQTGFIKQGIGVRVATGVRGDVLNAVVAEVKQYAGAFNPMAALFRKSGHAAPKGKGKSARDPSLSQVAFWWRFLEFGTRERHKKRTPKFVYHPESKRPLTQRRITSRGTKMAAFLNSPSRGAVEARNWVRPALGSSQQAAVQAFERVMRERTEAEAKNLPHN